MSVSIASIFPPYSSDTESETSSEFNESSPRFSCSIDTIFPPARSPSQSPPRLSFSIETFFHPARSPSQSDGSENYGSLSMEKREFCLKATIQVSMDGQRNFFHITEGEKARRKAMKIAVGLSGVESTALKGQNRDQLEVKGDNIDTVKLVTLLRKKIGHASIISVVKDKEDEPIQWPRGPPPTMRLKTPVMTEMFAPSCNFVSTGGNNHKEGDSLNS